MVVGQSDRGDLLTRFRSIRVIFHVFIKGTRIENRSWTSLITGSWAKSGIGEANCYVAENKEKRVESMDDHVLATWARDPFLALRYNINHLAVVST